MIPGRYLLILLSVVIGVVLIFLAGDKISYRSGGDRKETSAHKGLAMHPPYQNYSFGAPTEPIIDFGIQPLAVPTGTIPLVMAHDRILHRQLEELGFTVRFHSFFKGRDINHFLRRGDLEVMSAGDMPTVRAAAELDIRVVALAKQAFASVVAKEVLSITELYGRRIGNATGSSAHQVLLKGLTAHGMLETDSTLTPMPVNKMIRALADGEIAAFSAWEPTPTLALAAHPQFRIIFRALIYSYLYVSGSLARTGPEVLRAILAAHLRAIRWMSRSEENLRRACRWNRKEAEDFIKVPFPLTDAQCMHISRRDLLDPSPNAMIPKQNLGGDGHIAQQFRFLVAMGKIDATIPQQRVLARFENTLLQEIIAHPDRYEILTFSYE